MTAPAERRKPDSDFIPATPLRIGLEIAVAFAALLSVDRLVLRGDCFLHVEPHPFWLPVILAAILYGTGGGIAAAAIASALWIALAPIVFASGQDYFAYTIAIAKLPLLWTITALGLGEIATFRQRRLVKTLRREAKYVRNVNTLARRYARLNDINRTLQNRIASEARTAGHVAERMMACVRQEARADDLVDLIALVAGSRAFTLLRLDGDALTPVGEGAGVPVPPALLALARARRAPVHVGRPGDRAALGDALVALPLHRGREGGFAGLLLFHDLPAERLTAAGIAEIAGLSRWLDDLVALRWSPA